MKNGGRWVGLLIKKAVGPGGDNGLCVKYDLVKVALVLSNFNACVKCTTLSKPMASARSQLERNWLLVATNDHYCRNPPSILSVNL